MPDMMIWKNRVWFILIVFAILMLPLEAFANRIITSATLNGATSVSVPVGGSISAVVNVTTTNAGGAKWQSTGWSIGSGAATCVNHGDHNNSGNYSETFTITAPATQGSYSAYFTAYEDDACSAGAASFAMTNAVTVTVNPVPSISSIAPVSKNIGGGAFALTVNGSDFVNGAVVRFAGSNRTTTYVSPTQLTASIPASDLAAMGTFDITVFNPAPGGGTSNAQVFTVTPPPPSATTNAATNVTAWVATVHGAVSSNGGSTSVSFEYGLTTAYGYSIPATPSSLAADAVNTAVSADLIGLNCNTTFHYRVVATNSGGTTYGLDRTFNTGACTASYPANACAATRYGNDLNCNANDVNLTDINLAPGSISSCVSGASVSLDLDLTVNFASPDRWDVGIFIANDGKLPTKLPTNGGANSCSVDVLPTSSPFLDLDGVPQGTGDTCGDGNSSINGGTGSGVKRMTGVTLPCYASPESGGKLFVPFVVSWDNQKSPVGSLCASNAYPVPNTSSKCNAPASSVAINVVVLPVITKTNGTSTINPGANTTYTIVIYNNSGGTLQDMVFTDPAVTNLTVNSVTCAAADGATCPSTSVAAMQGSGIIIPSANLPNNSTLTFTVNAALSSAAIENDHIKNRATVTIGSSSTSAEDDDLIVISPTAMKSFAPGTITEGASSLLTISLTNPTATPITGVSFTDNYPSGMLNTASANGTTTCGGTVTAINNGNSLALSGGTIPASGSCTVTANITSAAAGAYTNSTGAVAIDGGKTIPAASAILKVDAPTYGAFNACDDLADPDYSCTSKTTVSTSHITTKVAGSPFTLDLVALKSDGSWNASFNGSVIVELLDSSDNSGALDSNNCRSSWNTVIATLGYTPSFSGSSGQISILASSGSFTVPNAYRDVRARVRNSSGTTRIGCSTDNFAIRPNNFALSVTDADWQTAGTSRMLNNTVLASHAGSSTGGSYPIHKAGQPFTVNATAQNAAGGTASNYAGAPTAVLGVCTGTACTPNLGTFALSTTGFVSGMLSSTATTYSEVGSFNLALRDTDFTAADAADTVAECSASGRYICGATDVGRFVPDHFALTQGVATPACSTFTYFGQDGFTTEFTLTAQNKANATTTNYAGSGSGSASWAKLPLTTWGAAPAWENSPGYGFAIGSSSPVLPSDALLAASATAPTASSGNAWASGTATVTVKHKIARSSSPAAPATVTINSLPVDSDGVTMPAAASVAPGTLLRYGRLSLQNAYGSELLPLPVPLTAEYWNGNGWAINTDDSCTPLTAPANGSGLALNLASSGSTTAALSSPLLSGDAGLSLSAPGETHTGYVDITIDSPAWLDFKWDGVNDSNPASRATFGIYKGNSKFIYIRELY